MSESFCDQLIDMKKIASSFNTMPVQKKKQPVPRRPRGASSSDRSGRPKQPPHIAAAAAVFGSMPTEAFFTSGPGAPFQHVYLYGGVSVESLKQLRSDIDTACRGTVDAAGNEVAPRPIVLHINSPGGGVFSGFSMMSVFNESRVPICACVDGISASAATFVSVLAPYRVIAAGAMCLVHDYAAWDFGKREDLLFSVQVEGETLTAAIKRVYLRRSNMGAAQLDELMERDLMLDAARSVRLGLCDRVLDAKALRIPAGVRSGLPLEVVLRKTNLNHIRFDCANVADFALGAAKRLDELLGAGASLKPVVLHADGMACLSSVSDHVVPIAQRVAAISALTETYGVIDTHVDLVNVLPLLHCHRRVMYSHAAIRVHLVYAREWAWTLRDAVLNTDVMLAAVRAALKAHTKVPAEIVDGLDKKRFLLTAADCLKYGIVDAIIEGA